MPTYTEQDFEDHIEQHLNQSDYRSLQSADYDKSLCLIPNETLQFIQDTQPDVYQRLERQYGTETPAKLLDRLSKQIAGRGVLDGLQCVQTLSRLNRVTAGKTDTLVLDFVNEPEQIQEAFQQYYQTTKLAEGTDPNQLYDLQHQLDGFDLYGEETLEEFCNIFYDTNKPDELLQGILDDVVKRWRELETEDREAFRSTLQSYIRLYGYISQLITFTDVALEKLYIFGRSLNKKLPKREHPDLQDVLASVDLDSFRVQRTHESLHLSLDARDSEVEGIGSDVAVIRDPEQDFLSNIIDALNSAYQTEFTPEDKVDLETMHQKVRENEELRQVIDGDNSESNKRYKFDEVFDEILLGFVNSKLDLYKKLSQPEIKADLKRHLYRAYLAQP